MNLLLAVLNYFDLGVLPPQPVLGKKKSNRLWISLVMYCGVILGVLCENWLGLIKTNQPFSLATFGIERVLFAVIIATAVFPNVFPKVFGRESASQTAVPAQRRFLQFCVAFQNGFFWQALLKLL